MKSLCVISGKGGTGKTVLTASFAALARSDVIVDCDVDAADMHLLLAPELKERHTFVSGVEAMIDSEHCTHCGECVKYCRFDAIKDYQVESISCEGCGVCKLVCPADAVSLEQAVCGEWFVSETSYGTLVHARLGIAAENSGKLVSVIRQKAKELAEAEDLKLIIIDGPPGIGCPVLASLTGVDIALIVTEPTLSGIHDMERVNAVCKQFGIETLVCINKFDINEENSRKIEQWCGKNEIALVGKIRFEPAVTESLIARKPFVEYSDGETAASITTIWTEIEQRLAV